MPGRQSHGRPVLPKGAKGGSGGGSGAQKSKKAPRKSRDTIRSKALDAFAIAEAEVPESRPKGIRTRDLEEEPERNQKRNRGDDDDFDEDDDEDLDEDEGPPRKKKAKKDDEFEGFSGDDSDEEEWHVGVNEDDEDSEIDSDEAFGESDEEKFDGYSFGGKKKKGKKGEDDESDVEDDESLGSDAIDLATALDQFSEDESGEEGSGSGEEEDSDDESSESEEEEDDDLDKLDSLQNAISGFAGGDSDDEDQAAQGSKQKTKLSLADLGLNVNDPTIKKSLKLMKKEEKATKSGSSKKLAVPLAKRQQDVLLRSAAYEKTSETLEKWIGTVKHNRRADHLIFPLAQNAHDKGLDNAELQPLTHKTTTTDLEQTIMAIMEESGLGPTAKAEAAQETGPDGEKLSQAEWLELQRQRRRERELHSREQARAKRIKKIKSKAYRRIHRKELAKEEQEEHNRLVEAGEIDSDDEREALDRRRALERVGARHRESKWAKLGKKAGRAVWDDNFRSGLTEITQRKEELRRRIEGRAKGSDDEDDSDSGDSEGNYDKNRLLAELDAAEAFDDGEPTSQLMNMGFMRRAEELRKKENDDLIGQIRRDLNSDGEEVDEDDEPVDIGRRQFGMGNSAPAVKLPTSSSRKASVKAANATEPVIFKDAPSLQRNAAPEPEAPSAPGVAGQWSRVGVEERKKSKKVPQGRVDELDLSNYALSAAAPKSSKPARKTTQVVVEQEHGSDDEDALHLPMAIRDQELIKRAFASEDVAGEFEREKAEVVKEDDDKEIDNTLPGWGSWGGEGVSKREKARHKGRFITKAEGVKQKDRKDFKLKSVIINEKRVKKNTQFLASQLPHPFESQQQYERSLRIPVGPEWTTKETFQQATKPRVIIKQGIIAPMSKPML
ncbi:Utp14 domain containing protein [Rhypophila decipiens]